MLTLFSLFSVIFAKSIEEFLWGMYNINNILIFSRGAKTLVSDKIRILLIKRKMTMSELADKIETTPQNLSNKLSRDNFNEKEIASISAALGCKFDITFTMEETGEKI